jgi:hypothetical protein
MRTDDEVFCQAFDSEFFTDYVDLIRCPRALARAIRNLSYACNNSPGNAYEVRLAWLGFYDIAGPALTGKFIASGAWRDFCPDIDSEEIGDTESIATLWTNGDKAVICRLQFYRDAPVDLVFLVEEASREVRWL